jgi:hypothetical protein
LLFSESAFPYWDFDALVTTPTPRAASGGLVTLSAVAGTPAEKATYLPEDHEAVLADGSD